MRMVGGNVFLGVLVAIKVLEIGSCQSMRGEYRGEGEATQPRDAGRENNEAKSAGRINPP